MISRVYPSGWGVGEKLTSAQANALDVAITGALDKRAGQADTLSSVVQAAGAGRIIGSFSKGVDADATFLVSGANGTIDAEITSPRTYTFGNTNALAGDRIFVLNRTTRLLTIKNAENEVLHLLGRTYVSGADSTWCELIFDGFAWALLASSARPIISATSFLADGTWTAPSGVFFALLIGWGGGGSGGGGASGQPGPGVNFNCGGGGGGGAHRVVRTVPVVPGNQYAVAIGAGGLAVGSGSDGSPGGDTTFGGSLGVFLGALGGMKGNGNLGNAAAMAVGGAPVRHISANLRAALRNASVTTNGSVSLGVHEAPGGGGAGYVADGFAGTGSADGFAGGNGGTAGINQIGTNTYQGGGGGGGGGAGPGGVGGTGGNGGAGSSTSSNPGQVGTQPGTGSGAGGGGGGSGGNAGTLVAGGAGGGAGGSGQLIVIPIR